MVALKWAFEKSGVTIGTASCHPAKKRLLSPAQLLNMSKDVHTIMAGNAAELWAPKGWDMLNEGLNVGKAVKGYDAVIGDIYSSYFNEEVVAEAEASQV